MKLLTPLKYEGNKRITIIKGKFVCPWFEIVTYNIICMSLLWCWLSFTPYMSLSVIS